MGEIEKIENLITNKEIKIRHLNEEEWKEFTELFTYNTNAIEGSTITLQETSELVEHKISPNKSLKDVKEMESHAKLFFEILNKKDDKLSNKLILKWHKILFQETKQDIAGKFRDYLIRVGSYRAPDWQDVNKLMKGLINFYKNNKKMNPVELSARMHYKFEKIHPFGDGNGRVGRLLMNYILWSNNYPILVIEYKKRKSYYKALQKDEDKFFSYFSRRYLNMHNKYLRR